MNQQPPSYAPVQLQQRVLLDKVCLGIISYLESLDECHEIKFQCNKEVSNVDFTFWEKRNGPFKLPNDLKKFYSTVFNGFLLNWTIEVNEQIIPVGELRVNSLEEIKLQPLEFFNVQAHLPNDIIPPVLGSTYLFSLDQNCPLGNIVLLYRSNSNPFPSDTSAATIVGRSELNSSVENVDSPEVWLLTNSCQLIYICQSFLQYLRLMVTHLGIFHWQLAFSDDGVPDLTEQYMHLFCKERLVIDKHYRLHA
jgi:hypothetical protein